MSSSGSGARVVNVGTPPSNFGAWITTEVHFHKFADLTTATDEEVESSEFLCFGHTWRVRLYPGGHADSDEGMVAAFLWHLSKSPITVVWSLSIRNSRGKEVAHSAPDIDEFDIQSLFASYNAENMYSTNTNATNWGEPDFVKRSTIIDDVLVDGTLTIEVRMRLVDDTHTPIFIPENPLNKNILNLFNDEESSDVVFEVGSEGEGESGESGSKRSKVTTSFYAHRLVLKDGATTLAEMCKSPDGECSGTTVTVSVTDVKPNIFKHMLLYIYGGKIVDENLEANAKDIIDAADKYGVVGLKLKAEACYVTSTTISVDNMIDNLLYADSKNCALLKEAVIDFAVENGKDIIGKVSFDDAPGSIAADLLTVMTRKVQKESANKDGDELNIMRVSELRKKLDERGLGVDGSREAMIAILKQES